MKSVLLGTMFYLFCVGETANVSVTKIGPMSTVCIDNNWSDHGMACYCNCKVHADRDSVMLHNVNDNGFLAHNQLLEWSCRNGGTKNTPGDLQCVDGEMGQPVCIMPTTTSTTSTTIKPTTATVTTTTSGSNPTSTDSVSVTYPTSTFGDGTVIKVTELLSASTTSTSTGTGTDHRITELLSASTTKPSNPEISVCSGCRCEVLLDFGIIALSKSVKILPKNSWDCDYDVKDGRSSYVCSLDNWDHIRCRSQDQSISDVTSKTKMSIEDFCKCRAPVMKSQVRNGSKSFHRGSAAFTLLFILVLSFKYMKNQSI